MCRRMGNAGCCQFTTRCLCHFFIPRGRTPHTLPLLHHEIPLTGDSSPQISPTWLLPMGCSSSQTAPMLIPSKGCSSAGTGCSIMGPPLGHKPCQQTCSSVGCSLCTGPQVLGRSLLQHWLPTGSQPPSGIHLFRCGVFHGLQVDICSTTDLHGLQRDILPHHGLHHGLQGKKSLLRCLEHLLPVLLH